MPIFSQIGINRLKTCHPDLQVLFSEVIKHWSCIVLEGQRGKEAQEAAFAVGNTKLHYPHGKHNAEPSLAVDVAPLPLNWKDSGRFYYFAGFVLGVASQLKATGKMQHGVRFGGDWDGDRLVADESFLDLVHYELIKG